jgi:hypothetical protein
MAAAGGEIKGEIGGAGLRQREQPREVVPGGVGLALDVGRGGAPKLRAYPLLYLLGLGRRGCCRCWGDWAQELEAIADGVAGG